MKSAKLLILAYRIYKNNLPSVATKIFTEAMEDETAPELMEYLFSVNNNLIENENDDENTIEMIENENNEDNDEDNNEEDNVEIIENENNDENNDEEDNIEIIENKNDEYEEIIENENNDEDENNYENLAMFLNKSQIAQLKAIANKLASKNECKLAKKLLEKI